MGPSIEGRAALLAAVARSLPSVADPAGPGSPLAAAAGWIRTP